MKLNQFIREYVFQSILAFSHVHLVIYTGWVMASFFYGYFFMQIPGGWIATRLGGKHMYGTGVPITLLLTHNTSQM